MTDLPTDLTERLRELREAIAGTDAKGIPYNDWTGHREKVLAAQEWLPTIISSLEELSRLKAGEGWQDISTAPKDGTWFLGWAESDQSPYRVSWGRPRDGKLSWCTKFAGFVDGYITHWMPLLPPAPGGWSDGP